MDNQAAQKFKYHQSEHHMLQYSDKMISAKKLIRVILSMVHLRRLVSTSVNDPFGFNILHLFNY